MTGLSQDIRHVLRSLRRSPGVAIVIVISLSLGMAAITTFFSFLNTVLLRPLPYRDAQRIRMVYASPRTSTGIVAELAASSTSMERIAGSVEYGGYFDDDPRSVRLALIDSGFIPMLEPQPELGALPTAQEVHNGEPILLISDALWRQRFNAASDIVGRRVTIRGQSRRIVAVLSPTFTIPFMSEAWAPLAESGRDPSEPLTSLLVKLRNGSNWEDVQRDLRFVSSREQLLDLPKYRLAARLILLPEMVSRYRGPGQDIRLIVLVLGAAACLLLVVCTNVALLMMVRGERKRTELVIRAAIGASRWQLIRQQIVESVILSLTSAAIALTLAYWGIQLVVSEYYPPSASFPGWMHFGLDWRVATFSVLLALISVTICGVWPARVGTRLDLQMALRGNTESILTSRDPTRSGHLPVVFQLALGLPLFVASAGMALTYRQLSTMDPGYEPGGLYRVQISPVADGTPVARTRLFRDACEAVLSLQGVQCAMIGRLHDLGGMMAQSGVFVSGSTAPVVSSSEPEFLPIVVSDNYFRVLRIPMTAGRTFTSADQPGTSTVAVVSEEFATRAWGVPNVVGRTLTIATTPDRAAGASKRSGNTQTVNSTVTATVVGVVKSVRRVETVQGQLGIAAAPTLYLSEHQALVNDGALMVRSAIGVVAVRRTVLPRLAPLVAATRVTLVAETSLLEEGASSARRLSGVLGVFAVASLGLGLMGIYAIVSFGVERRTRESGVRMALGAQRSDIVHASLLPALKLTGVGLLLGVVLSIAAGRVLTGFVIGGIPVRLAVLAMVTAVFGLVALLAGYMPALRAARLDPMAALRS